MTHASRWDEFRTHTLRQLLLIVGAAFILSTALSLAVEANRHSLVWLMPSEMVMGDVAVEVSDHRFGEDPDVTLSRDPLGDLPGRFITDVRRVGEETGAEVCSVARRDVLYQDDPLDNTWTGPLSRWLRDCEALPLSPGRYRADVQRWVELWGIEKRLRIERVEWIVHP